jgi:hypothetical protein
MDGRMDWVVTATRLYDIPYSTFVQGSRKVCIAYASDALMRRYADVVVLGVCVCRNE